MDTSLAQAARHWRLIKWALAINPEDFPFMGMRCALATWWWIGANLTVLSWINEGFHLPLVETPPPFNMVNSIFTGDDLNKWRRTLTK